MYLAYVDDSGTRDKNRDFQLLTGVIVEDREFSDIEIIMGAWIEKLVPSDKLEKFEEFHAWELFGGHGVFEGLEQELRFAAVRNLLTIVNRSKLPIVYGVVRKTQLAEKFYGSADPLDICFRFCLEGIEDWVGKFMPHELALLISDEFQQKDVKTTLKKSFRQLRKQIRPPYGLGKVWHLHDAMYFGDSKDSMGIQLADLCGYFIAKHLAGDEAGEGFYDLIRDRIVYKRSEPEGWA